MASRTHKAGRQRVSEAYNLIGTLSPPPKPKDGTQDPMRASVAKAPGNVKKDNGIKPAAGLAKKMSMGKK